MSEGSNTTGRQLCAYCRTELAVDALFCEACGMSQAVLTAPALKPPPAPPEIPAPSALTGPALRPPPEPPAVTAPTLLPPPDPPALTAPAMRPAPEAAPALGAQVPRPAPEAAPALGAQVPRPAPESPPALAAGDPLAAEAPPMSSGDPLAAALGVSVPRSPAPPEPRVPPAAAAPADRAPAPEPAAPEAAAAHPSDATPPGYITAASLWPASQRRPGAQSAKEASAPDAASPLAEAASVARPAPAGPASNPLAPIAAGYESQATASDAPKPAHAAPQRPPAPVNRSRIDRRTAGIVAAIVALATAATVAVVVLTGGSEPAKSLDAGGRDTTVNAVVQAQTPKPVVTTAASATAKKPPDLDAQVKQLDGLMQLSKRGRAEAVKGDMRAATASRAKLLRDIDVLRAKASDKELQAALASFAVAITEALRQNRECGSKCSTADLDKVGRLKQAALGKLNPLLKAHGASAYRRQEI